MPLARTSHHATGEAGTADAARPRIIAVVPTYHPDGDVVRHIGTVAAQVDRVIVVDDGTGPTAEPILTQLAAAGVEVVRRPRNVGIAGALNAGVRLALADGADYVLNLDQDTQLPDGYVDACLRTFAAANRVTRLGIVCTDSVNGSPSLPSWYSPENLGLVPEAIQSGFLISRECLEKAGLFDERLVIDCVDTEYCVRVRGLGFRIAVASGTDISHTLGEMVPFRPFGIRMRNRTGDHLYQYHSPFRQYYIIRNNIDLVFRYFRVHPRWTLWVIKRQLGPAFDAVVSGPHRTKQAIAILVGGIHGLLRRRGMIPPALRKLLQT
jgi:rhamnosyltransferase